MNSFSKGTSWNCLHMQVFWPGMLLFQGALPWISVTKKVHTIHRVMFRPGFLFRSAGKKLKEKLGKNSRKLGKNSRKLEKNSRKIGKTPGKSKIFAIFLRKWRNLQKEIKYFGENPMILAGKTQEFYRKTQEISKILNIQ